MPPRKRAPLRVVPDPEPAESPEPSVKEALAAMRQRKDPKVPTPVPGLKAAKTKVHAREADRMRAQGLVDAPPAKSTDRQVDPDRSAEMRRRQAMLTERLIAEGSVEIQTWHELDEDGNATGRTEQRQRIVRPVPDRRCRATIRRGEWAGNRCLGYAIRGGVVCKIHGGTITNVKKAAQTRLAMAADPAAAKLIHIALRKPGVVDADRIRAITAILDRAGISGAQVVELEVKPWQAILQRVAGQLPGATDENVVELEEGVDYTVEEESGE
jgi:hypothetical protein